MIFTIRNEEQAYEALCRIHQEIERAIVEKQTLRITTRQEESSENPQMNFIPDKHANLDYDYMD